MTEDATDTRPWLPERVGPGIPMDLLILIGLVVVGFLIRLPAMTIGLWTDEVLTVHALTQGDPAGVAAQVVLQEQNPPGYYLLIWPWTQLAGVGEIALKVPSLLFGLLLIPATYALGRIAAGRSAALVAAVVATLSGPAIYQAQEARPYTLVALLTCLSVIAFVRLLDGRAPWAWAVAFVVIATGMLYAQYPGGLVMLGLGAAWIADGLRRGRLRRPVPVVTAFAVVAILFVPWLPVLRFHLGESAAYEIATPWSERLQLMVDNLGYGLPLPSSQLRIWGARGLVLLAVVGLGWLLVRSDGRRWLRDGVRAVSTGLLAIVVVVVVVTLTEAITANGERHMFIVSPLVWVLLGAGLVAVARFVAERLPEGRGRVASAIVVGVGVFAWAGVSVAYAGLLGTTPKSGVRTIAEERASWLGPDTLVVLAPDYLASAYEYYRPDGPVGHGIADFDGGHLESTTSWRDAWLSLDPDRIRDRIADASGTHPCLAFIYEPGPYPNVGLPYEKSDVLYEELVATYPVASDDAFPGRDEHPRLVRFDLRPGGCARS